MINKNSATEDAKLVLHLDNTTIHRLQFLLSKGLNSATDPDIELMNVLHLLESLLIADQITIATFENEPSQIISNSLLEVIDAVGSTLSVKKIESSLDTQLKIARETVIQIFDQNLLSFIPVEDNKIFTNVNVAAGRPSGVIEINSQFWIQIFNERQNLNHDEIIDRAAAKVIRYKTDALFIYGISHHFQFYSKLMDSYSKNGIWTEELWNKLHVMFRSYFNQNLSHELGSIYSPPPIRAITLESTHNKLINDIKSTIDDLPHSFLSKENVEQFDSMAKGIHFPIPLIGIAAIPKNNKKDKNQFIDNFLKVREDTLGLRNIVRKLNLFETENNIDAELNLLKESYEIKREIAELLKLNDPTVFPRKVNDIGFIRKNIEELGRFLKKENKTARFFSNLLLRMKETPNLNDIKGYLNS